MPKLARLKLFSAGLLGAAAGRPLVASEVFSVSVWDNSLVILVGNEPLRCYVRYRRGVRTLLFGFPYVVAASRQAFPLHRIFLI